jgi:inosose dehydratase
MKVAGAPISWGVCEVPGWGYQLPTERVLAEAQALGLGAIEAGPPGFLPRAPDAARSVLETNELQLVGGFVTAVLHERARLADELATLERYAQWLRDAGGEFVVLAPAGGRAGYEGIVELERSEWTRLFDGLARADEIAARRALRLVVHPHVGTAIERREHIERFLEGCDLALCLDTGHAFIGGADPARIAREVRGRVQHVHLKDANGELAEAVRERRLAYGDAVRRGLYRPLGAGDAEIAGVLEALAGYQGWGVLEQDVMLAGPEVDPRAWIAPSVAFARAQARA